MRKCGPSDPKGKSRDVGESSSEARNQYRSTGDPEKNKRDYYPVHTSKTCFVKLVFIE